MTTEIIHIDSVEPKVGKKSNIYYKLNGNIFIWEEEFGKKLKDNIGKTFNCDIDRTTDYPKLKAILEETDLKPEVVRPGIEIQKHSQAMHIATKEVRDEQLVLMRDKPNSRTFGQGKDQVKIYFSDGADLFDSIQQLEELKLMPADWKTIQGPTQEDIVGAPSHALNE